MQTAEIGKTAPVDAAPETSTWRNWSGGQSAAPQGRYAPSSEAALAARIAATRGEVRVVGAGHSFSAVVPTSGTLVSLDGLTGLIDHDPATLQATVWAGTRLYDLGAALRSIGQGLANQGDIDRQSLAGAVSTGTHGTGAALGCMSTLVCGLRLVAADGSILECSAARDPDLFAAARVSLGALGILTQIRLQNRPAYRLCERTEVIPLREALAGIERWKTQHRHVELFVFPYGDLALVKRLDETTRDATPPRDELVSEDLLLRLACATTARVPSLVTPLQRLAGRLVRPAERVGDSFAIFPSERNVRFNEMEYQVPSARGVECLAEVVDVVRKHPSRPFIPIEFRYVAGDDLWLSPFEGGERASISVHQTHLLDHRPLFGAVEPVFRRHGGRPHWGKLHSLTARELAPLYPRWDAFQRARRELDPRGRFLNPHLKQLFGEAQ